ncbi:hypothetical protein Clacol_010392 [Clathrus columnatus]|uniref:Cytochrome P450 n=1 Tax=Clathrus columnatus TaxID=1419009 RepID=A0AAV5ARG4_9AGAM|nr:hypothetical protein Clacol_010392 [Clathrus columnatus]
MKKLSPRPFHKVDQLQLALANMAEGSASPKLQGGDDFAKIFELWILIKAGPFHFRRYWSAETFIQSLNSIELTLLLNGVDPIQDLVLFPLTQTGKLYNNPFRSYSKLPPGPPAWPIFGYLPGLPDTNPWGVFNKWSAIYGDVFYVPSFRNHVIVLNSAEATNDLLEKRGSIYSGRPYTVMLYELMDLARTTIFARYGSEKWRSHRKIYTQQMGITAVKKYRVYQSGAARNFLRTLLESPEDFSVHCRTLATEIIMNAAYGYQIAPKNDEMVELSESVNVGLGKAAQPGFFMIDNFPIPVTNVKMTVRHIPLFFPFTSFKTYAAEVRRAVDRQHFIPFRRVVEQMRKGTAKISLVSGSLSELDGVDFMNGMEEFDIEAFENRPDVRAISDIAGGIFRAGSATMVSVLQSFILAMVVSPASQKRAQEELDHVLSFSNNEIGKLPTFEDLEYLPYIKAMAQELLRWFPVAPTAVPHATTLEDTYKGYRIPKGSILIPNVRPDRFLPDETGKVAPEPLAAFGFGRRICPGRHLAEGSIQIMVASVLAVFNISPALDVNGNPIDVGHAFDGDSGLFK